MEFVAAYLLCIENGKKPTVDLMETIIKSVNPEFSKEALKSFASKIEGKTHEEIMAAGSEKMSSMAVNISNNSSAQANNTVVEEKVEEEEESEEIIDMF